MTGHSRSTAISGKVKSVSGPANSKAGVPEGMRLLDGVPVPIQVGGLEVHGAKWAAKTGIHARRTLLVLADGSKTGGCGDCPFTHVHWAAITRHREVSHGAPHGARYSRTGRTRPDQLPLPPLDPPPAAAPLIEDHLPPQPEPVEDDPVSAASADVGERRKRPGALAAAIAAIPDEIGGMTLLEMLHHAGRVQQWQATNAHLVESRDQWKARALAAERTVARWEKAMAQLASKFGFELKLPDEGEGEHGE